MKKQKKRMELVEGKASFRSESSERLTSRQALT